MKDEISVSYLLHCFGEDYIARSLAHPLPLPVHAEPGARPRFHQTGPQNRLRHRQQ